MNVHEETVIKAFVEPSRHERFLGALANPKKRRTFTNELNHLHSRFLVPTYIRSLKGSEILPDNVYGTLRSWVPRKRAGQLEEGLTAQRYNF